LKTILLIDVMNMFIRNFSSLTLTNDNGEHVGGMYGTLQSLVSSINKFNPDLVYCAWEGKGSSERRRKVLQAYKEGRKFTGFNRSFEKSDEDERDSFKRQLQILKIIFDLLPVYHASVDYLEADDVIAYLCKKVLKEDYDKVIISNDRDYFQLLDDKTRIFRPVRTKADKSGQIVTSENKDGKHNIVYRSFEKGEEVDRILCHPENYILCKCVEGDSDNIDGIPRVGMKTFLKDFSFVDSVKDDGNIYTITDIIEYAKSQKEAKYKKYLKDGHEQLLLRNQELIQLLDPDISLKSRQSIERSVTANIPKFNRGQFRIRLIKENMNSRRLDDWITSFNRLKPECMVI
jgi:DNA polymerase I